MVSGVGLNAYSVSSYVWDLLSAAIPVGFTLIVLAGFDVEALIGGDAAVATGLLFLTYALSMVSQTDRLSGIALVRTAVREKALEAGVVSRPMRGVLAPRKGAFHPWIPVAAACRMMFTCVLARPWAPSLPPLVRVLMGGRFAVG